MIRIMLATVVPISLVGGVATMYFFLVSAAEDRRTETFIERTSQLPVGIRVVHTPAVVQAPQQQSPRSYWKYQWVFRTDVHAIERELEITEFAILAWNGSAWFAPQSGTEINGGVLNAEDFREWYGQARIAPDLPAIDRRNWAGAMTKQPFRQKWVYVGKDTSGRLFRGEAVVELK